MMLNRKQEQIQSAPAGGQLVRAAIILVALLLLSGAATVQAQEWPNSFTAGGWFKMMNPQDHAAYYLPYYDGSRVSMALSYYYLASYRLDRRHHSGYWYPWSFRWGRYDVPNNSWWSFGEGFVDDYGTGGIWMAGEPLLAAKRKTAVDLLPLTVEPVVRAAAQPTRVTRYRGTGLSDVTSSRGSSISSSDRGSSSGSSGGVSSSGSSGGGSFGGSSKGGKK